MRNGTRMAAEVENKWVPVLKTRCTVEVAEDEMKRRLLRPDVASELRKKHGGCKNTIFVDLRFSMNE